MDILNNLVFMLLNGFVWGSIIALIALGLSLIFGLTEILNLAHGELYMLGAVITWVVVTHIGNFWLALIIAPICVGVLGLIIYKFILKPVENNILNAIIITFGLSLILQYCVLASFGAAPQRIAEPIKYDLTIFNSGFSFYRIVAAVISCIIVSSLWIFLNRTKFGLWMRAVSQNKDSAISLGIPVQFVYLITFGLGSALAALGGVLAAPIVSVSFNMGLDILVLSFMAAIIGGLGNLKGTFAAAILIAEVENILSVFSDPVYARIISLIIISAVLIIRPGGLLLKKA